MLSASAWRKKKAAADGRKKKKSAQSASLSLSFGQLGFHSGCFILLPTRIVVSLASMQSAPAKLILITVWRNEPEAKSLSVLVRRNFTPPDKQQLGSDVVGVMQ